jgi:uncharacterized protein YcbX
MISLAGLYRYPVKSMGGETLTRSEVGVAGLPGDRGWALSDGERGAGQGAKRYPALMGYGARYLAPPGAAAPWPTLELASPAGETRRSDDPALNFWLSDELGSPVRLEPQAGPTPFFDDAPLLLMSEAALAAAAALSPGAGELRRFRPNLLLTGTEAGFPEDEWLGRCFRLGSATFEVRKRCPRCVMTTLGFRDVPEDRSVLSVLRAQRQSCLGVYLSVVQPGAVTLGDSLHWL